MATFIKAGFWEKLCQKCTGYKGWLNLDQFVEERAGGLPYKVYTALLTQEGTAAPVATILQNTLGSDITWNRQSSGIYYGQNINFADSSKVWMSFSPNYSNQGYGIVYQVGSEIYDDGPGNALWFTTNNFVNGNGVDDWATYIPVEIRIYP